MERLGSLIFSRGHGFVGNQAEEMCNAIEASPPLVVGT